VILDDLKKMIQTEHVLVVQDDGFILNPAAWDDKFLEFDYIGAPWPPTLTIEPPGMELKLENRVGNGGFSLRSRRLLEICSFDALFRPEYDLMMEDLLIGHFNYRQLVEKGMLFADLSVASRFSGETPDEDGRLEMDNVFGFHGGILLDALASETRRFFVR
jgi:hypothetical protein